jgi:hypothetical protein
MTIAVGAHPLMNMGAALSLPDNVVCHDKGSGIR